MKALITRPREDAEEIAAALHSRGFEPVLEPLLSIHFASDGAYILSPLLDGAQALVFTSANGVRAFAQASERRDFAVFAVGDATAQAAWEAGFTAVESAGGAVADLAELARARLRPEDGALVHAAAGETAGDLAAALAADGFEVRRAALYEAVPAERLSAATTAMLRAGEIGLALFFSPRTANAFVHLAAAAGVEGACGTIDAAALSGPVAAALEPLPWRRIVVAAAPNAAALLAAIDEARAGMELTAEPAPIVAVPQRHGSGAMWVALALVVVVLALVGTSPFWAAPLRPFLPWGGNGEAQRVAALEARIARLEAQPQPTPQVQEKTAIAALTARVAALEKRPAAQGDQAGTAALAARVDALERKANVSDNDTAIAALKTAQQNLVAKVDAMEHRVAANGNALSALKDAQQNEAQRLSSAAAGNAGAADEARRLAAAANLQAAVASGLPFRAALDRIEALHDPQISAAVKPLQADAAAGVPPLALLADRFRGDWAPAILRAAAPQSAGISDAGFGAEVMARIKNLVRVRRVGDAAPASDAAKAVAAAQAALASGDLAEAVAALKPLSGPAAQAAQPFISAAEQRIAAQQAMGALAQALGAKPEAR